MPEEINRVLTDQISDYLFTTESVARKNLLREGIPDERIFFVGNVMIDSLLKHREQAANGEALTKLGLRSREYVLVTAHRPSNVTRRATLSAFLDMLDKLSREVAVVFPVHPRTRAQIETFGLAKNRHPNLQLIPPLGYLLDDQATAGIGANWSLPFPGLVTVGLASSHAERGVGQLVLVGFERRTSIGPNIMIQGQYTTSDFTQLGLQPGALSPRLRLAANLGLGRLGPGSANVNYLLEEPRVGSPRELVSGFYTLPVSKGGAVSAFITKSLSVPKALSVGVSIAQRFGGQGSGVLSYGSTDGNDEGSLEVQRSLPVGEGFGYRARIDAFGSSDLKEAEGSWRTSFGTYSLGASTLGPTMAYRASADGGVGILGGEVAFMRTVENSFAMVRVGEYEDVSVLLNNQPVAQTNEGGVAWVPGLLDYQDNVLTIDVLDLPLEAKVTTDKVIIAPYFRSAAVATFDVKPSRGALLRLILDDGEPMPVGSTVLIDGAEERFPVALRGEVYVTGLEQHTQLLAFWRNQSCAFEVDLTGVTGPIPRVGPIVCSGVAR